MLVLNAYVQNPPLNANTSRRIRTVTVLHFLSNYTDEKGLMHKLAARWGNKCKPSCVDLNCFLHVVVHMYIQQDSG